MTCDTHQKAGSGRIDPSIRSKAFALVALVLIAFITLKTHRTYAGGGDQPHYLLIAESLWSDGDLEMRNQYPAPETYLPHFDPPGHCVVTARGRLFPFHDIGLPVFMIPLLAVIHHVVPLVPAKALVALRMDPLNFTVALFSFQSMAIAALLALELLLYFRSYGFDDRWAFGLSALAVLTPPLLTHAYLFFTEIYSAAILLGAVLIYRAREPSPAHVFLYALAVFALSWLHIKNELLVLALGAMWFSRFASRQRWFSAAFPMAVFALALAIRLAINWHYFGKVTFTGGWNDPSLSLQQIPRSLVGMLFDRETGLLFCDPLIFFLPLGLWASRQSARQWWACEGLLVMFYLAAVLPFYNWWAGWSPAGRHLVPIIPLLWLPLGKWIQTSLHSESFVLRWPCRIAVAATCFISAVLWQNPQWGWTQEDGINRWMHHITIRGVEWQWALPKISATGPYLNVNVWVWTMLWAVLIVVSVAAARAKPQTGIHSPSA